MKSSEQINLFKDAKNITIDDKEDYLMKIFVNKIIDRVLEDQKQGIVKQ